MLYIGSQIPFSENPNEIIEHIHFIKKWGGNCFQIFIGDPQTSTFTEKKKINPSLFNLVNKFCKNNRMKGVIHSSYKLNLSTPIDSNISAINNLIFDLEASAHMGFIGVIIHMGSQRNLSYQEAFHNYIDSIIMVLDKTDKYKPTLILETSAGEGMKIGKTEDDLFRIFKKIPKKYYSRIGLCIDTAHIWGAGVCVDKIDVLKNYLDKIVKCLGKKMIKVIHLNDSGVSCGSRVDKHAPIGEGEIFKKNKESLKYLVKWCNKNSIPMILETGGDYKKEIKYIRDMNNTDKNIIIKKTRKINGGGKKDDLRNAKNKIIDVLTDLKQYYSASGDRFRVGAYQKAIHTIKKIDKPITSIKNVEGQSGIGKSMLEKIKEILEKGDYNTSKHKNKDAELLEKITSIYGIGPSMGRHLIKEYKLISFPDFIVKVKSGKIKLSYAQKMGFKYMTDLSKRIPRSEVKEIGDTIMKILKTKNKTEPIPIKEFIIAGSYSMNKPDSKDVDIIISINDTKENIEKKKIISYILEKLGDKVVAVLEEGKMDTIILFQNNKDDWVRHVDIKLSPHNSLPFFKFYFCSGVNFNKEMRRKAKDMGYKLNQYGIWEGNKKLDIKTEKEIFKLLGEPYKNYKNR